MTTIHRAWKETIQQHKIMVFVLPNNVFDTGDSLS